MRTKQYRKTRKNQYTQPFFSTFRLGDGANSCIIFHIRFSEIATPVPPGAHQIAGLHKVAGSINVENNLFPTPIARRHP